MVWFLWRVEKETSEKKGKWKFNVEMFSLFDVKIIQIWTFPAAPSTERVPSLAERDTRLTSDYLTGEYLHYYLGIEKSDNKLFR